MPQALMPQGLRRLLWFVAIWVASVAALGAVAWPLRVLLKP